MYMYMYMYMYKYMYMYMYKYMYYTSNYNEAFSYQTPQQLWCVWWPVYSYQL